MRVYRFRREIIVKVFRGFLHVMQPLRLEKSRFAKKLDFCLQSKLRFIVVRLFLMET